MQLDINWMNRLGGRLQRCGSSVTEGAAGQGILPKGAERMFGLNCMVPMTVLCPLYTQGCDQRMQSCCVYIQTPNPERCGVRRLICSCHGLRSQAGLFSASCFRCRVVWEGSVIR